MRSLGDFGMGPVCYLGDRGERIGRAAREIIIADRIGDDLNMQSAHCRNPAPAPAGPQPSTGCLTPGDNRRRDSPEYTIAGPGDRPGIPRYKGGANHSNCARG
jgi:hypothetical protein